MSVQRSAKTYIKFSIKHKINLEIPMVAPARGVYYNPQMDDVAYKEASKVSNNYAAQLRAAAKDDSLPVQWVLSVEDGEIIATFEVNVVR
jgi:hypothetical protein